MEFLSLQEPVEVPSVRVSRSEAILVSIGLHLLLLLLFLFGPGVASRVLPGSILALLGARPARASVVADSETLRTAAPEPKPQDAGKIPLKFAYVRTPDDNPVEKNPAARLLSDKTRRARQEVPTPPTLKDFSMDPHSEGTTVERIRPDPRLAEGKDALDPAPAGSDAVEGGPQAALRPPAGRSEAAEGGGPSRPGQAEGDGNDPPTPEAAGPGAARGGSRPQGGPEGGTGTGSLPADATDRISDAARDSLRRALSGQGEESKRLFDNPGYLSPGYVSGTMSFDTQGFPWGDYARRIKVIIDNAWGDRLPLAFREGVRGYLCVHFTIQKDGTISDVQVVQPSTIPPFNRAVLDTLRAVSPLPPLPEDFPGDREGTSGCFFYNMLPGEIRELMR